MLNKHLFFKNKGLFLLNKHLFYKNKDLFLLNKHLFFKNKALFLKNNPNFSLNMYQKSPHRPQPAATIIGKARYSGEFSSLRQSRLAANSPINYHFSFIIYLLYYPFKLKWHSKSGGKTSMSETNSKASGWSAIIVIVIAVGFVVGLLLGLFGSTLGLSTAYTAAIIGACAGVVGAILIARRRAALAKR